MSRTVSSPDGNRWYVRRVWLPWRLKWRGKGEMPDSFGNLGDASGAPDSLEDVLVVIGVVIAVVLVIVFVWPLLLALLELVLLLVLVLLGMLARVAFRRPWIVEATPATGPGRFRWKVVGWRRSGEVVELVAAQLGTGARSLHVPDAEPC